MRTLVEAPRKKKQWTKAEENYLQDKWGTVSIKGLAKALGRSENAVVVRARRLGCGAHLAGDTRVSLHQLMLAIYGGVNMGSYTSNRLIREGLPVKWHIVKNNRFRVIDIDDFWKWAEKNKSILDFSRFEKYTLGAEPDWVDIKRKADFEKLQKHGEHNAAWTSAEDNRLRYLLDKGTYTYTDLARELRHSEGAVKRRILDLKIDKRPVRVPSRKWTEEEIETLCKMVDQGYDFTLIAEKLNRTALATRGKYERLQNPEYNKRYNRGQNDDYEYQGIRSISGKDILKDRKLMDGAEFQELEPVEGGENDGVYMQAMRSTV